MVCSLSAGQEEKTCGADAITKLNKDQQSKLVAALKSVDHRAHKNDTKSMAETAAAAGNVKASSQHADVSHSRSSWSAPLSPRESVLFLLVGELPLA
jgi:hypothetical protein